MDWIEQAIFTSAETDRSAGYQVVAASPGVCEADVRALAVWCPSHDALLDSSPQAASLNFHPLPSANYCVSRTMSAGWEYSGRGGMRIYTHCLIVSPETLGRFANSPFALMRAALAAGRLRPYRVVPKQLEPVRLAGRAAAVDSALLARLCSNPGPDWLATLVQAALSAAAVAVAGGPRPEQLIAGLINCFPPECRTGLSFSTGLKFSPRRPFRWIALSDDGEEQRRVRRVYDVEVLDLSAPPPVEFAPIDSWPRFIQRLLRTGRTSLLANQFSRREGEFAPGDLPALGLQLLEELDASSLASPASQEAATTGQPANGDSLAESPDRGQEASTTRAVSSEPAACPGLGAMGGSPAPLRARGKGGQAAHGTRQERGSRPASAKNGSRAAPLRPSRSGGASSGLLDLGNHEMLEKLEHLDELVYEAIAGSTDAMSRLQSLWPRVRAELEDPLLAESREQYLRHALSVWRGCVEGATIRNPARAIQALDVLCLLFDEK